MQSLNISKRLTQVASYLPKGALFADIGSDHAYLPCYVCGNDSTAYAIASEVNNGPYLRAKQTVQSFGLMERIDVRLGNGLDVLYPDEVEQLVMSGMGAKLICDILINGVDKLRMTKQIIAQPNINEPKLRKLFMQYHYDITDEKLVEENGHVYEIIIADKMKRANTLTEKELFFGPVLLRKKSSLFYKKWKHEFKKRQKVIHQMKNAKNINQEKINSYEKELRWIGEVLKSEKHDCSP